MAGWTDLSDDELAGRLIERGADPYDVRLVVAARDEPDAIGWISARLAD